jgi:hypothetical protein
LKQSNAVSAEQGGDRSPLRQYFMWENSLKMKFLNGICAKTAKRRHFGKPKTSQKQVFRKEWSYI